jgi:hypothetical protein
MADHDERATDGDERVADPDGRLESLRMLRDRGAISDVEYVRRQRRLLAQR